jgi:hypothetical protein
MSKKIEFRALDQYAFDTQLRPFPASQAIPKWWREMTPYLPSPNNIDGKKLIVDERGHSNATAKKCTPMLDAITSGYIIPLWADVLVSYKDEDNGEPSVSWRTSKSIFEIHGPSANFVERPPGYRKGVLKYLNGWIPITPKGYSCLITSPFGYKDLPLHAVPGIIDSDKSLHDLTVPMWLKDGFEGIIEKGTPLIQVTPFKRESWQSEFSFFKNNEYDKEMARGFEGTIVNHYIKNIWSKKTYK